MDYSKLSDKALAQIASGKPLDYSKLDDSDLEAIVGKESSVSPLTSAARGGVQGLSLDFADELAGGLKHPVEAARQAGDSLGLTKHAPEETANYRKERDSYRAADKAAKDANPMSFLGGNLVGSLAVPGTGAVKLAAQGLAHGVGGNDSEDVQDLALSGALGAGAGAAIGAGAPMLAKGAKGLGQRLSSKAEQLAENATGATRMQAEKFAPGAGRQLLDRGVVKALSRPSDVAKRATEQLEASQSGIGSALGKLDEQGASLPKEQILNSLKGQLEELSADPSKAAISRKLRTMIQDIESESVSDSIPLSAAEEMKRGYQGMSNYAKPNTTEASKRVASTFRQGVEDQANAVDPELASQFNSNKETYGLLRPIQEAAQKRALQQSQSPHGGLLDTAASVALPATLGGAEGYREGGIGGAVGGAIAGAVGRRVIAPRISSTLAVGADKLGQALQSSGIKVLGDTSRLLNTGAAKAIQAAAAKGKSAVHTTHFLLMQSDPTYRRAIQGAEDDGTE